VHAEHLARGRHERHKRYQPVGGDYDSGHGQLQCDAAASGGEVGEEIQKGVCAGEGTRGAGEEETHGGGGAGEKESHGSGGSAVECV